MSVLFVVSFETLTRDETTNVFYDEDSVKNSSFFLASHLVFQLSQPLFKAQAGICNISSYARSYVHSHLSPKYAPSERLKYTRWNLTVKFYGNKLAILFPSHLQINRVFLEILEIKSSAILSRFSALRFADKQRADWKFNLFQLPEQSATIQLTLSFRFSHGANKLSSNKFRRNLNAPTCFPLER